MNSTNRALNRLLILIVAVLLIACGAVAVVLGVLPQTGRAWAAGARALIAAAPAWVAAPAVGAVSVLALCVGAVAAVLAVLLVVFVLRQGRGHTGRVVEQRAGDAATTVIDLGVPRTLLEADLADRPEFVATRISAYRVRRNPVLKVSVQCRRGVAPTDAAEFVVRSLRGLDEILGVGIPALIQVSGGVRSRVSSRARLG